MEVDTLIHARWVLPVVPNEMLEYHSIAILSGNIVDLLPTEKAKVKYSAASTHQCDSHVLLPGLINAHTHAAMNLFKGLADDLPLMDWLQQHIWPAEQNIDETFIRDGTNLAIAEMLRSGTTTFNDMYLYPEVTAQCVQLSGIRASIGLVVLDFPTPWANDADEYITKGLKLHDEIKQEPLITAAFAPHAPYTVSDEPFKRIAAIASELEMPIHIHLHETAQEISASIETHDARPIERLNELGLITPNLIAVHMTQMNDSDIKLAAMNNINIVHCPESNLKLGSGICPVTALKQAGVNVALGTDSSASNNDLDMMSEMRTSGLLAKGFGGDATALPANEILEMATINGARALQISDKTGSLEPGKSADIIAVNLDKIETQPVYNPLSTLIYSASRGAVEHVWVAGRQLLKNRQLITLDYEELLSKAKNWREKISKNDHKVNEF